MSTELMTYTLTDIVAYLSYRLFNSPPAPLGTYYASERGINYYVAFRNDISSMKISKYVSKVYSENLSVSFDDLVEEIINNYVTLVYDCVRHVPDKSRFMFTVLYIDGVADLSRIKKKSPRASLLYKLPLGKLIERSRVRNVEVIPGYYLIEGLKNLEYQVYEGSGRFLDCVVISDLTLIHVDGSSRRITETALAYATASEIEYGIVRVHRELGIFYMMYICNIDKYRIAVRKTTPYQSSITLIQEV